MKILVCMLKYDYGITSWGLSHEWIHIYDTFEQMKKEYDFQIIPFDFGKYIYDGPNGIENMNKDLLSLFRKEKPDMVWFAFFQGNEFYDDTLREMRESSFTVNQAFDDQWRFENFSKIKAPLVSMWLTPQKKSLKMFEDAEINNAMFSPFGVNTNVFYPIEGIEQDIDISFVGQPHSDRSYIINSLKEAGFNVQTFGRGWQGRQSYLEWKQVNEIYNRSKINLNLTMTSDKSIRQLKGRNFEICAAGGFQLTEEFEEIDDFFKTGFGREIMPFEGLGELIYFCDHYLHSYDRIEIAQGGYERTLKDHTWKKRILGVIEEGKKRGFLS